MLNDCQSGRDKAQTQSLASKSLLLTITHIAFQLSSWITVTEVTMNTSSEKKNIFSINSFPIPLIFKGKQNWTKEA